MPLAVHPHGCGEYAARQPLTGVPHGSPPRLWGIPPGPVTQASAPGGSPPRLWGIRRWVRFICGPDLFTPTAVGNTQHCAERLGGKRFTPTACGEYSANRHGGFGGKRFTPTAVGNTMRARGRMVPKSVHPHGCGEYVASHLRRNGYSVHPHGCGEYRKCWLAVQYDYRFTPTAVGNTKEQVAMGMAQDGSPPRLWGILPSSWNIWIR